MATKGPSNRYGNSNGAGGKGRPTSNINYAWAKDFGKSLVDSHYEKHSKEFGNILKNNIFLTQFTLQTQLTERIMRVLLIKEAQHTNGILEMARWLKLIEMV